MFVCSEMEQVKPLWAVWIETNEADALRSGKYDIDDECKEEELVRLLVCFFFFVFFLFFLDGKLFVFGERPVDFILAEVGTTWIRH